MADLRGCKYKERKASSPFRILAPIRTIEMMEERNGLAGSNSEYL